MFANRSGQVAGMSGVALLLVCAASAVRADCPAIDFENLAIGVAVTTQYSGVTFSVQPQSCSGSPPLYMCIAVPTGGTTSGTKALQIDQGCPDFSPDYLRMVFTALQREVSFTLGEASGAAGYDFDVRYYSDAGLLGTKHIESASGVHALVHIGSPTSSKIIRRVEVQSTIGGFEVIDDLVFNVDTTPPTVYISAPITDACACGSVLVRGVTCDSDGAYGSDKAEYLGVDAAPGTAWTLIDEATVPVCTEGLMYSWNTSALPAGRYFLRVTATNACGLTASDVTTVYVDRTFDSLAVRYPLNNQVIGGQTCVDGTAWDWLCFDEYTVMYRPSGGATWTPVDDAHPSYTTTITTDPLAVWNTPGVSNGDYDLRVTGIDTCGNTASVTRAVTVDNKTPAATITSPAACSFLSGSVQIRGTAQDTHIDSWILEYAGGKTSGWSFIASGTGNITNNALGTWNVSGLERCAYILRLRVYDRAVLHCNSSERQMTEFTRSVFVGDACDVNGDGLIDGTDIAPFVQCLLGT